MYYIRVSELLLGSSHSTKFVYGGFLQQQNGIAVKIGACLVVLFVAGAQTRKLPYLAINEQWQRLLRQCPISLLSASNKRKRAENAQCSLRTESYSARWPFGCSQLFLLYHHHPFAETTNSPCSRVSCYSFCPYQSVSSILTCERDILTVI